MRQAGLLAAAGLYALTHNVARLKNDHRRASQLGQGLIGLGYDVEPVQTNMVYVNCSTIAVDVLGDSLIRQGIKVNLSPRLRLVTHMDIDDDDIAQTIKAFAEIL